MRRFNVRALGIGFLVVMSLPIISRPAGGAVLVEKGRPRAVIVVDPKAPDSVQWAARELQNYLEQVGGAKLAVQAEPNPGLNAIYVGESEFTRKLGLSTSGLTWDGFKIIARDTWMAILGRDYKGPVIVGMENPWRYHEVYNESLKLAAFGETGTLYGVYRFLEDQCGVRWYMPGDLGTVVSRQDTIRMDHADLQVSPVYQYRYPWYCNFPKSDDDVRWYRRAGFGAPYPAQITHSFKHFLKYKDTHPDYFALIGGRRDFSNLSSVQGDGNLCLSNPKVIEQWVADIDAYFDQNPNQYIFPLSPNDGTMRICECPACRKQIDSELGETGKFSNYVWTFVDKVARGVAVKHPDKFVGCIAYEHYNYPPTRIKQLSPNTAVMICKTRGSFADPAEEKQMRAAIGDWAKKTKNIYCWEYYLYSWLPWRNFPVVFPHLIASDLKFLNGISRGEFIEAESNPNGITGKIDCPGMAHLNLYITARLLWNPNLNVDDLLNDYYEKFYGPAREPMKDFWTTAETIWTTKSRLGHPINVYTRSDLDHLSSCLDQATGKAPDGSVYRKRVALIKDEFLPAKRKLSNGLVIKPPTLTLAGPVPPVKLDGRLDDPAWQGFDPFEFVDNSGEVAPYKTWGYAAWDEENLYLAFLNYEPQMNKLTAGATRRDQSFGPGMWEDDSVELFFCLAPKSPTTYFQFIVNSRGQILDAQGHTDHPMAPKIAWNSGAEAKSRLESNRWVLEMRIPLKDLGLTAPVEGKSLSANFFRNRYCGDPVVYSCWSPSLTILHATPERFGHIQFKKK